MQGPGTGQGCAAAGTRAAERSGPGNYRPGPHATVPGPGRPSPSWWPELPGCHIATLMTLGRLPPAHMR